MLSTPLPGLSVVPTWALISVTMPCSGERMCCAFSAVFNSLAWFSAARSPAFMSARRALLSFLTPDFRGLQIVSLAQRVEELPLRTVQRLLAAFDGHAGDDALLEKALVVGEALACHLDRVPAAFLQLFEAGAPLGDIDVRDRVLLPLRFPEGVKGGLAFPDPGGNAVVALHGLLVDCDLRPRTPFSTLSPTDTAISFRMPVPVAVTSTILPLRLRKMPWAGTKLEISPTTDQTPTAAAISASMRRASQPFAVVVYRARSSCSGVARRSNAA